jgi:hypothetical protein
MKDKQRRVGKTVIITDACQSRQQRACENLL